MRDITEIEIGEEKRVDNHRVSYYHIYKKIKGKSSNDPPFLAHVHIVLIQSNYQFRLSGGRCVIFSLQLFLDDSFAIKSFFYLTIC